MENLTIYNCEIVFGICVIIHNFEESLSLSNWVSKYSKVWFIPNQNAYFIATNFVSLVICGAISWQIIDNQSLLPISILSGFTLAMVVNAFVPHLLQSLTTRTYMPGLATGIFLNAPSGLLLLSKIRETLGYSIVKLILNAIPFALLLAIIAFGGLTLFHKIIPPKAE